MPSAIEQIIRCGQRQRGGKLLCADCEAAPATEYRGGDALCWTCKTNRDVAQLRARYGVER